jgi:Mrp family chromosome partitioning ATPase
MDIVERLIVTRARIEAAVTGPCVLAVTSALPSDGSAVLASALAESLILAGHSVLVVGDPALPEGRAISPATTLAVSVPRRDSQSVDSMKAAFEVYRQSFEYTIVDASVALASGSALAFTRAADFVIVAFEEGRAAREADRELARTLRATGAALLGVVTLERNTIRSFGKQRLAPAPAIRAGTQLDDGAKRGSALSSTVG